MKSFWEESYDSVKDRRYGMLFFATLLVFFSAIILGAAIYGVMGADIFQEFVLPTLPGVAILLVALGWWWVRRARKRRRERLKYAALSRDELAKARSKLRNNAKPMRRAAPRAPDIDLKY
jgi:ABC-type nickel/cobalt efflux system permease component RcnA